MMLKKSIESVDRYIDDFLIPSKKSFTTREGNGFKEVVWNKKEKKNLGARFRRHLEKNDLSTLWVYNAVKKQARKFIEKNGLPIEPEYSTKTKDYESVSKLVAGERFFCTDLSHCYWRIAYLEGYISGKLYRQLVPKKHKLVRNKALACISSKITEKKYVRGKRVSIEYIGDKGLEMVYANIRSLSGKMMSEARDLIGDKFLFYKTDGIYYTGEDTFKVIEEYFKSKKMLFRSMDCFYCGGKVFLEGKEMKDKII